MHRRQERQRYVVSPVTRERVAARVRLYQAQRRDAGVCIECGSAAPRPGTVTRCDVCHNAALERGRRARRGRESIEQREARELAEHFSE